MRYVYLGNSELEVSGICLGTGGVGVKNSEENAFRIFDRFVAEGGNFLDTARVYSDWVPGEVGRSERIIGDWLASRGRHPGLIIATKGGHPPLDEMSRSRLNREDVRRDVESSLRALRVDTIDLYYYHRDDPGVPVAELVDIMEELVTEGKIRYYGCSNWKPSRIQEAADYATERGLTGFVANQPLWNIGSRNMRPLPDRTLVSFDDEGRRYHRESGVAVVPYSSQAEGFFSKLSALPEKARGGLADSPYYTEKNLSLASVIRKIAAETGTSPAAVVLSYLISQPMITVPVIGAYRMENLEDSLSGTSLVLSGNQLETLEHAIRQ